MVQLGLSVYCEIAGDHRYGVTVRTSNCSIRFPGLPPLFLDVNNVKDFSLGKGEIIRIIGQLGGTIRCIWWNSEYVENKSCHP